jgi:hypothetical protein
LLVFSPKEGWDLSASSLACRCPKALFPRVNSRDELTEHSDGGGLPPDPETGERMARGYIEQLKAKAFAAA